jgi:hypothetical protein
MSVPDRTVYFLFGYGRTSAIDSLQLSLGLDEDKLFKERLLPKARHTG